MFREIYREYLRKPFAIFASATELRKCLKFLSAKLIKSATSNPYDTVIGFRFIALSNGQILIDRFKLFKWSS